MNQIRNNEFKVMTLQEAVIKVEELRRELFTLRLNAVTTPVKSFPSQQRQLKRSIARGLTHVRDKIMQERG